jgi:tetratricopeptide (TPR) repeat protein
MRHWLPPMLASIAVGFAGATPAAEADNELRIAVDRLIASVDDPRRIPLQGIDDDTVVNLAGDLGRFGLADERTRLFRAFARSPRFQSLSPRLRSLAAVWVIRSDAALLNEADAVALLGEIRDPQAFIGFLALRDYAAIWLKAEARVGASMGRLLQDRIAYARSRLKWGSPDDQVRWALAEAYYHAGQFDQVVRVAGEIDHRARRAGKLNREQAWTLNLEAYALDALGRRDEGDAVFDLLAGIPLRAGAAWLSSFRINRVLRLVGYGEWQRGIEAAAATDELVAGGMVTVTGQVFVAAARACALANLGRTTEAASLLPLLDANRMFEPQSVVRAHLCAGQEDRAAAIVIESLGDPRQREAMATALQGPGFELFYPPAPALPGIRQALRHRPDVARVFDQVARDVPAAFAPRPWAVLPGQEVLPGST